MVISGFYSYTVTVKLVSRKATLIENAGIANTLLTIEEVGFMIRALVFGKDAHILHRGMYMEHQRHWHLG